MIIDTDCDLIRYHKEDDCIRCYRYYICAKSVELFEDKCPKCKKYPPHISRCCDMAGSVCIRFPYLMSDQIVDLFEEE